jgi:hypothetical protein
MFFIYGRKCLSRKAVHNLVEKFSQGRSKLADDARPVAEVGETTVKRLLCCGSRRTGKAMGQVYQCLRRIYRISHVLRFVSICDLFTDSASYCSLYGFALYLPSGVYMYLVLFATRFSFANSTI